MQEKLKLGSHFRNHPEKTWLFKLMLFGGGVLRSQKKLFVAELRDNTIPHCSNF